MATLETSTNETHYPEQSNTTANAEIRADPQTVMDLRRLYSGRSR